MLGIEPAALAVPAAGRPARPAGARTSSSSRTATWPRSAPITVKRTQGGESVIGSGLKAGEQVVTDGQLRLVNGAAVRSSPTPSRHRAGRRKAATPRG